MNRFKKGDKVKPTCFFLIAFPNSEMVYEIAKVTGDHLQFDNYYSDVMFPAFWFELAEPVEGSAEWAWEQIINGKPITHATLNNNTIYYCGNEIQQTLIDTRLNNEQTDFTWDKDNWCDNNYPTGWQIYTPAKFADVKKDDYVLFNNNIILQVIGVSDDTFIVPHPSVHEFANFNKSDGRHTYGSEYHALRKFPASEVQIEIKLKPMRISNGYSNERLKIINELDIIDFIDKSAIQNIDEVEALLAQQEKEKK